MAVLHGMALIQILLQELNSLFLKTNLKTEGPYPLEETTKILSNVFKCQFFIFEQV